MPQLLKPNTPIGEYRVLQCVGRGDKRLLYLANRGATPWLYWLLQSDQPVESFRTRAPDEQEFGIASSFVLAVPVSGSSLATLARMIRPFEWKFITTRWVEIATNIGYLHSKNQIYQRDLPFSFQSIVFNSAGEAVPLSYGAPKGTQEFPAPEMEKGAATASSDVYSLGAALAYLISDDQKKTDAPLGMINALKQATAAEPSKRFRNAAEFAHALARFLPVARAPRGRRSSVNLLPVIVVLLIALLALGGVVWSRMQEEPPAVSSQTSTAIPTLAPALPPGPLAMDSLGATLDNCTGQLDVTLSKGGQPISSREVAFEVFANGAPIPVALLPVPGASGQYRGALSLGNQCFPEGTIRVGARAGGVSVTRSIYARGTLATLPKTPSLGGAKLGVGMFQMDVHKYPEMVGYFGLTDQSGNAARLQGSTRIQIAQDGQDVSDFVMTPVDPNALPLTVALAVDVSGSMRGDPITQARVAAISFVNQLGVNDAACVYSFETTVKRVQSCTTDKQAAIRVLSTLNPAGNTALYDAMVAVANDHAKLSGRQAIIILSDGADTASKSTQADALTRLRATNLPLYTIGLAGKDFNPTLLKQFAQANGGSYLETPNAGDLRGLYDRIQGQLKNQYRITFRSLFPDRTSGNVTIRLTTPDQVVEATRAYVVSR
jgi:VWFA-related protein